MPLLLTKSEAAATLSISVRQLEMYVRRGVISTKKLGKRCVRIERSELDRFVEQIGGKER